MSKEHTRELKRQQMRRYRAKKKNLGFRLAWTKEPPKYAPTFNLKLKGKKLRRLKQR